MVWSSFLWDWTNYVLAKVCTRLQTLQQKVQKYEANMEKDNTHNQNVSQIVKLFAQS
jgi:BMFP domain-containing protein YqiC